MRAILTKFLIQITCLFIYFFSTTTMSQTIGPRLDDSYNRFKEKSVLQRHSLKHRTLLPLLEKLKANPKFTITTVGESFEKRDLVQVKYGSGKKVVLLWSQMHGDEATATMAMLDIFNFLSASGDDFDDFRKQLATQTTLYFVPMLNPDGVERWQRRTALDIDMNRDALRLVCPESQLLKKLQNTLKPLYGFNLHDQSPRYSVGHTPNVATISFLATAYDYARSTNAVRERSMQLIVGMNRVLQQFIPNQVARYSDEHEPRAFGDNIQKWGTSLVLIESGGYKNDPEKQYIRQMNYIAILSGLEMIASGEVLKEKRSDYIKIPQNEKYHFDFVIRNATVTQNGQTFKADVAINHNEMTNKNATGFSYKSTIEDYGDLSVFYGIEEFDAQNAYITDTNGTPKALKMNGEANFILQKDGKTIAIIENGFLKKQSL
jgi:Zinc carboxypeptidase